MRSECGARQYLIKIGMCSACALDRAMIDVVRAIPEGEAQVQSWARLVSKDREHVAAVRIRNRRMANLGPGR